jgi:hypothetical protein
LQNVQVGPKVAVSDAEIIRTVHNDAW